MVEVKCIASGSTGNCYLLKMNGETVILDAGCDWNKILANQNLNDVLFAYISHEHKDHSLNYETLKLRGVKCLDGITNQSFNKVTIKGKNMVLYRVPIRHGKVNNAALIIQDSKDIVLYATDFNLCEYDLSEFKFTHILVECNYLEDRIKGHEDAKSIRQINTHMGLEGLKVFLSTLDLRECKEIDLIHLSQQYGNNVIMGSSIYSKFKIKTGVCQQYGGIEYYG